MGAAIYSWIKTGELKGQGSSISEGIGQGRVTGNLDGARIDDAFQIPDSEMLPVLYDLVQKEGLLLGGSSGINVAGAIRLARAARARQDDRDGALRLGLALSVEAVQPGVLAREGSSGAAVACVRSGALSRDLSSRTESACSICRCAAT